MDWFTGSGKRGDRVDWIGRPQELVCCDPSKGTRVVVSSKGRSAGDQHPTAQYRNGSVQQITVASHDGEDSSKRTATCKSRVLAQNGAVLGICI